MPGMQQLCISGGNYTLLCPEKKNSSPLWKTHMINNNMAHVIRIPSTPHLYLPLKLLPSLLVCQQFLSNKLF